MKEHVLENIVNREKFVCLDLKDIQVIDGIEYLKVQKYGSTRTILMRKDALKKVKNEMRRVS